MLQRIPVYLEATLEVVMEVHLKDSNEKLNTRTK